MSAAAAAAARTQAGEDNDEDEASDGEAEAFAAEAPSDPQQLLQYSQPRNDCADLSEWRRRKSAGECFACLAGIHLDKGSQQSLFPCPFHGSSQVDPSDPRNVARAQLYGRDKH